VRAAVGVALEAWESAGLHEAPVPTDRVGLVVAGNNLNGRQAHERLLAHRESPGRVPGRYALHMLDTDHVGTVSQVLGITGEGYTIGGGSASGNVGIISGTRLVASGAVDACLVVGALTDLSPTESQAFANLGAMAVPQGLDHPLPGGPFDESRRGFAYGQGAGCLVLESAASAARRGAPALGVVAGFDQRLDGNALADPSLDGEIATMTAALRMAGVSARDLGYVNAHGSGSALGDETEARALRAVLGSSAGTVPVNATKGLTGHCLSAAGVIEAIVTLVQLRDRFLHPNHALSRPVDPALRFVGPVAEATDAEIALSNAFGFGGFDTSVVLARSADADAWRTAGRRSRQASTTREG
jgi:malonyl-ACP decarboxylase